MGTQTAPTPTTTTGLRKAAILMLSLGEDAAAEVFKHLREDDIEQLTREISMISIIQPTEKDTILEEFYTLSNDLAVLLADVKAMFPTGGTKGDIVQCIADAQAMLLGYLPVILKLIGG